MSIGWHAGDKPDGPGGVVLGKFGCLMEASDETVCDTILGPRVGDTGDEHQVKARFRWIQGIAVEDGASLGQAWLTFVTRSRMVGIDGPNYKRVAAKPYDWKKRVPPPPPRAQADHRDEALANADRRQHDATVFGAVFNARQLAEIRRLFDQWQAEKV